MTSNPEPILNYFAAPPARRARFIVWVVSAATLIGGTALWLFLLRDWRILSRDHILIGGWFILGTIITAIWVLLKSTPVDAIRLPARSSRWIILAGAVLLQGCAILFLAPALSDDVLRYRLDGRMWLSGQSPYAVTPDQYLQQEWERVEARVDALDELSPFRHLHTIYPPTAQLVFVGLRGIDAAWDSSLPRPTYYHVRGALRDWVTIPGLTSALTLPRIAMAVAAITVISVLLSILCKLHRSPWYAVLLGWNPLFVLETGGMGHVDVVGVLFILLTIRALQSHRSLLAAGMLALAVGVKPPAFLLAPFLFRDAGGGESFKRFVWLALAFMLLLAVVYSPMLIGRGYLGWLNTARIYTTSWEANGSIYELIKSTAAETDGWSVQRAKDRARLLAAVMVVMTVLMAWRFRADLMTAGYWIFLVILLYSPVVYPWYLLWPLCLVQLLRGWQGLAVLIWAATIGVSYLLWRTNDWVLPTRWLLVQYVPVYVALLVEVGLVLKQRAPRAQTSRPLTVVV